MGNELVFCFAGVSVEQRPAHTALVQELLLSDVAPQLFLRLQVDGATLACPSPIVTGGATCWVGKSSYVRLKLALVADCAGCAALALFNGRSPMTGPPDPALVSATQAGLLRSGLAARLQADEDRPWRALGEWQQLNAKDTPPLQQRHALVITGTLFSHDGSELDGTHLAPDWEERVSKCAAAAALALGAQHGKLEKANRRRDEHESIRQGLAGDVGDLLQAMIARGRSPFAREAATHIAEMAFHGETAAQTVARVIREAV